MDAVLFLSINSEQEIDGETLELMMTDGCSVDQLILSGLKTVKQQLRFKKLLMPSCAVPASVPATHTAVTAPTGKSGKLSRAAIKDLNAEEKRMYLIK